MAFYNAISNVHDFSTGFTDKPKSEFGIFAKGYHRAAATLAEQLLERGHSFRDYEAYPVVFLYRHAFELYLKHLIYAPALLCAFKFINDLSSGLCNDHRLVPLAQAVAKILKRLFPNDDELKIFLQKVLTTASEFTVIDPRSESYRYPITRGGDRSTPANQTANLQAFHSTMSHVLDGLEAVDFGLNVETDIQQELHEISQEFRQHAASLDSDAYDEKGDQVAD